MKRELTALYVNNNYIRKGKNITSNNKKKVKII